MFEAYSSFLQHSYAVIFYIYDFDIMHFCFLFSAYNFYTLRIRCLDDSVFLCARPDVMGVFLSRNVLIFPFGSNDPFLFGNIGVKNLIFSTCFRNSLFFQICFFLFQISDFPLRIGYFVFKIYDFSFPLKIYYHSDLFKICC